MSDELDLQITVEEAIQSRFRGAFGDRFKLNVPLDRYTSARIGGPAEMFVAVNNTTELITSVELAYHQHVPYLILGGGSNVLIADRGVKGLVILNKAREVHYRHNGFSVVCTVESGMNLSSLARQCIAKGLGGLEWAVSVPGTVGGAVVGNAGAHGGDMSGSVLAVNIWEPGEGERIYSKEELSYGYRDSVLKQEKAKGRARKVVLSAELELKPDTVDTLVARADAFVTHRKQSQPRGASVGSMFKNPENYYAGYLIEAAGLKGFRAGKAQISDKHANFFICEEGASADDVRALIAEAWNAVREKFGVELELEVEMVGEWVFDGEDT